MAHVLVVEDDEQVRVLAEAILKQGGHTTASAAGVESAKALVDTDARIEVLFTDIQLGTDSEGGVLLARHARDRRASMPVVYTSGIGPTDGLRAAFVEGAHFLPKPYTPDALLSFIAQALEAQPGVKSGNLHLVSGERAPGIGFRQAPTQDRPVREPLPRPRTPLHRQQKANVTGNAVLTAREIEVLKDAALGMTASASALKAGVSKHTIAAHRRTVINKLGVENLPAAVALAFRLGFIK